MAEKDVSLGTITQSRFQIDFNPIITSLSQKKLTIAKITQNSEINPSLSEVQRKLFFLLHQQIEEKKEKSSYKLLDDYLIDKRREITEDEIDQIICTLLLAINDYHLQGLALGKNMTLKNVLLDKDLNIILIDLPNNLINIKEFSEKKKDHLLHDYLDYMKIVLSVITRGKQIDLLEYDSMKKLFQFKINGKLRKFNFEKMWEFLSVQNINKKYQDFLFELINWKNEEDTKIEEFIQNIIKSKGDLKNEGRIDINIPPTFKQDKEEVEVEVDLNEIIEQSGQKEILNKSPFDFH